MSFHNSRNSAESCEKWLAFYSIRNAQVFLKFDWLRSQATEEDLNLKKSFSFFFNEIEVADLSDRSDVERIESRRTSNEIDITNTDTALTPTKNKQLELNKKNCTRF